MSRMKAERRFLTEDGPEIFTGNELLVKGALETEGGVHLLGGYPGSPIAGYFDSLSTLADMLREKNIRAIINNNEALAAAMVNGTQALPTRVMIAMKCVGLHVAADALALGNLAGAHRQGGAIIVYGDDPWCDSTQVPADSRYLSKHLFIPVIEPSNQQEGKDFVDLSFKLSSRSEIYVGYLLPTNLADGGGTVICKPNQFPRLNTLDKFNLETGSINLDKRVLLPPRTNWQEDSFVERFSRAMSAARELGLNKIEYPVASGKRKPIGFVAAGLGHDYLVHALHELGALGEFPILKFGMSYPVDPQMIKELTNQCERIVVVEERRGSGPVTLSTTGARVGVWSATLDERGAWPLVFGVDDDGQLLIGGGLIEVLLERVLSEGQQAGGLRAPDPDTARAALKSWWVFAPPDRVGEPLPALDESAPLVPLAILEPAPT